MRQRALACLARREHGRGELARKLYPHGKREEVDALLDELERAGWLSDARYAEALTRARAGRHGSLRLKQELRDKGVADSVAAASLALARANDLVAAREVWRKRFGEPPADRVAWSRQMRFLVNRGFPADIARRVVGGEGDDGLE